MLPVLTEAIRRDLPWDGDFLSRLAAGRPVVPGLAEAIAEGVHTHGDPGPALMAASDLSSDGLAVVVDALLAWAAEQPTDTTPAGKGLVREARVGVDDAALRSLVERVATPAREAALEALEPVVLSAEP